MEKNKVMMIVIIILLVVLLATIVGVSFVAFRVFTENKDSVATTQQVTPQLTPDQIDTLPLSSAMSTNLAAGSDGTSHIIKLSIAVGVNNTDKKLSPEFATLVQTKEAIIRDIALDVVKSKTYEELSRPDGRDILREEILVRLQNEFKNNLLVAVYISDWYLQ